MNAVERAKKNQKIHLSKEQETALLVAVERFDKRPTFQEYEQVHRTLKKIAVAKPKCFANVKPGFYKRELVPLAGFNPETDIAEGWCLYPCWDSGNNHRLINAAQIAWTTIWNFWDYSSQTKYS